MSGTHFHVICEKRDTLRILVGGKSVSRTYYWKNASISRRGEVV